MEFSFVRTLVNGHDQHGRLISHSLYILCKNKTMGNAQSHKYTDESTVYMYIYIIGRCV